MRGATRELLVIDDVRGVAILASPGDAGGIGTIGDHADDLGFELAAADGLVDGLKVRAAAGEKDRQSHGYSIQLAKPAGGTS